MKELSRKEFIQLAIPIGDQLVSSLLLRRHHIAVRRLSQLVVFLKPQSLMQVTERLLLGHDFDVITACVAYKLANLIRCKRATSWANQRISGTRERMLHVERVHVQLERREGSQLALDIIDGRHRAAADVVRDAAPTHRGPVGDLYSLNERFI